MNNRSVAGPDFRSLNPFVFGEARRHHKVLIVDDAFGRNAVLPGHAQHNVGFPDLPAFGELRPTRQIFWIAFRRAPINPGYDGGDVLLREASIVLKSAVLRIGVPGRHRSVEHLFADRLRPRPRVLEGHQRHWGDLARSVTARAVLVEDRSDVLYERGLRF